MTDSIQLFRPKFRSQQVLKEIQECLDRGWTGLGYKTIEFEKAWCEYTELPHAHFLNSATAGLHLAVKLLKEQGGWRDGDEIITTPLTFVSTNHAILYERLQPVFADVDEYLCLDPCQVVRKITERTRAVMFVGLAGNPGQLEQMAEICKASKVKLILDAAHMAGTWLHGKHIGPQADVAVFSFQAVKNLPTADSGMVCFKDAELDRQAREWSWLGIDKDTYARTQGEAKYKWQYDVPHVGFKYHGNSIMAAIGLVSLRYVEPDNCYRRMVADWYDARLADCPGVTRVPMLPGCTPSRHLYQVLVDCRDEVMVRLNAAGIYPGVHYRDNTEYPMYAYADGTCPHARAASEALISLPLHLDLKKTDVERIATELKRCVNA